MYIYIYEQGVWGSGDPAYFYIHISVNVYVDICRYISICMIYDTSIMKMSS